MGINRRFIRRPEDATRGDVDSFELLDGSRYSYDAMETYKVLYLCALNMQLGEAPDEHPEFYVKLCQVRDPEQVLERLQPHNPASAFVDLSQMYDRDILVGERRLVPLVAEEPEELFE